MVECRVDRVAACRARREARDECREVVVCWVNFLRRGGG